MERLLAYIAQQGGCSGATEKHLSVTQTTQLGDLLKRHIASGVMQ